MRECKQGGGVGGRGWGGGGKKKKKKEKFTLHSKLYFHLIRTKILGIVQEGSKGRNTEQFECHKSDRNS